MRRGGVSGGGPPLTRVALAGPMGAGKSAVGRRIAAQMGEPFVDLDERIGDIPAIFAREGEAGFRARETAALREAVAGHGVLALGGGALEAAENRELLASWPVVVLMARLETLRARIGDGAGRPLAAELAARIAARAPTWERYPPWVWTDGRAPEIVAQDVLAALEARCGRA